MLERIHPLIYIYCGNTELWWWWWKWWFTYPIAWSTGCNLFDGATAECFTFSLRGEQAKLFALLIAERVAITNLCECERKKAKEILVGSYPVIIIRAGRPRIQHTHAEDMHHRLEQFRPGAQLKRQPNSSLITKAYIFMAWLFGPCVAASCPDWNEAIHWH